MTITLILITSIYLLFPFLSTPILLFGIYKDKKNYIWYMSGIILNLALIGYYYIPNISNDLYRHFIRMDMLRDMSISEVLRYQPLIIQNLWFYLISLTNNYNLLPFTAIIITFYFTLKPLLDFGKNEKLSNRKLICFVILILAWMHLIWPISGVRNSVAIALFFYGLYKEFIKNDNIKRSYIYYILSTLIHYSVFVLIILRIIIKVFKKIDSKFMGILLLWGVFTNVIIGVINKINVPYLEQVANKAIAYTGYTGFSNFGLFNIGIMLIFCMVYIYYFYKLKKTNKEVFYKYESFYKFGLVLSLFCIGAFNNLLIVNRFGYLVLSFLPFVIMPIIRKKNIMINSLLIIYYIPFIILGLFIQLIQFRYASFETGIINILSKDILRLIMKI